MSEPEPSNDTSSVSEGPSPRKASTKVGLSSNERFEYTLSRFPETYHEVIRSLPSEFWDGFWGAENNSFMERFEENFLWSYCSSTGNYLSRYVDLEGDRSEQEIEDELRMAAEKLVGKNEYRLISNKHQMDLDPEPDVEPDTGYGLLAAPLTLAAAAMFKIARR